MDISPDSIPILDSRGNAVNGIIRYFRLSEREMSTLFICDSRGGEFRDYHSPLIAKAWVDSFIMISHTVQEGIYSIPKQICELKPACSKNSRYLVMTLSKRKLQPSNSYDTSSCLNNLHFPIALYIVRDDDHRGSNNSCQLNGFAHWSLYFLALDTWGNFIHIFTHWKTRS